MTPESIARLLAQVDTSAGADGCWPWRGYVGPHGYGAFNVYAIGAPRPAHRLLYELVIGPVPDGLVLDHVCHTFDFSCVAGDACLHRRCCNLTHLEPVTEEENKARMGRRIQTCVNGHPFTEANTYYRKDRPGRRSCRACVRANGRRYVAMKRDAQQGAQV